MNVRLATMILGVCVVACDAQSSDEARRVSGTEPTSAGAGASQDPVLPPPGQCRSIDDCPNQASCIPFFDVPTLAPRDPCLEPLPECDQDADCNIEGMFCQLDTTCLKRKVCKRSCVEFDQCTGAFECGGEASGGRCVQLTCDDVERRCPGGFVCQPEAGLPDGAWGGYLGCVPIRCDEPGGECRVDQICDLPADAGAQRGCRMPTCRDTGQHCLPGGVCDPDSEDAASNGCRSLRCDTEGGQCPPDTTCDPESDLAFPGGCRWLRCDLDAVDCEGRACDPDNAWALLNGCLSEQYCADDTDCIGKGFCRYDNQCWPYGTCQ